MDSNKPTLIGTGLSGMVGSRFVELNQDTYHFINLDLTTNIDITNPNQVKTALSNLPPTTVLHFAAFTDVSKAFEQKGDKNGLVYQVNVIGTKNIAQACKEYGHHLIHISTDFVFDGQKDAVYTEADTPNPIEWYGQTKYQAEQIVQNSGCQSVIARLAFPFRSHFPQKLDLVRNILEKLKTNSLYPMFADQIITPTFTDDLCVAIKTFITQKTTGIYHVVGNTFISPFRLAQKISNLFSIKANITPGSFKEYLKKDPRPRQQYMRLSNQKLQKDLGIKMKDLDQALETLKSQLN